MYTITNSSESLNGVMLRGRLRKFALEHNINLLCENTTDIENGVRFAILQNTDVALVIDYLDAIIPNSTVTKESTLQNPVLSKMKVNIAERYEV